jgi:Domain of unknown function (DUF4365)
LADNPNPTEDLGYAFVQQVVAKSRAIWRRQSEKDIGVDGLIEVERRDGASAYIAVQIKTGKSYFSRIHQGKVRIYLRERLRQLSNLTLPAIIVLYDPDENRSCWENIHLYVLDNPDALESGYIDVPLEKHFDSAALDVLRQETRTVVTPVLENDEVADFLRINTLIGLAAFVPLAQSVLNKSSFRSRSGIPPIDFLQGEGLVEVVNIVAPGPPFWRATDKGSRYVQFLLGDRYFVPFAFLEPGRKISDKDVYICLHLEDHLKALQRPDLRRIG